MPRWRTLEFRIKNRFLRPLRIAHLLQKDASNRLSLPFRTRLRAWSWGFKAGNYALYQLDRNDRHLYVRDDVYVEYFINDVHAASLNNKISFALHMERFGMRHPRALAFVDGGRAYPLDEGAFTAGAVRDAIPALLEKHGALVAKPVIGAGGARLLLCRRVGGGLVINGVTGSLGDLVALLEAAKHVLVTEFAESHEYARSLYPQTPNTLRLLSLWDLDRNEPFLASAVHRIGASRSIPVDNFHQGRGGLSAPIDLRTGRIGAAVTLSSDARVERHSSHPETGAAIEGVEVPGWQAICRDVVALAGRLPHVPCIGWDLIVTPEGASAIEANCPPGLAVWQAHGPLLADPRARRFFEAHGWV